MNRPKVIVIQEASIDGKLAVSVDRPLLYGDERWEAMRGERELNVFQQLLSEPGVGATLEGSNSFVLEAAVPEPLPPFDGDPNLLYKDYLPEEIVKREGHRGWFIAVDGRGRIRWMYKDGFPGDDTWKGWYALILVSYKTPISYLAYLQREQIPYLVAGNKQVDLILALEKIKSKLRVETLLSTAGGRLNGALLKAGLIDEVNIEFLPGVIGGGDAPALFSGCILGEVDTPTRLKLLSCTPMSGGQVWLRYEVVRS
jgi:2,5-diamino-6-(ribosylamino)-4(3H)-pyrimidinone 5'-phosphate reductase